VTNVISTPYKQLVIIKDANSIITTTNFASAPVFRTMQVKVFGDGEPIAAGNNKLVIAIPPDFDGTSLVDADAYITTVDPTDTIVVQLRNITNSNVDMLSTRITIDPTETTSYTATIQPVINTANDNVSTGNLIAVDVDIGSATAMGLGVVMRFT